MKARRVRQGWRLFALLCALCLAAACGREEAPKENPAGGASAPAAEGATLDINATLDEAEASIGELYWSHALELTGAVLEQAPEHERALALRKRAERGAKHLKMLNDAHAFFAARNYDKAELWAGSIPEESPYAGHRRLLLEVMLVDARILPEKITRKGNETMHRVVVSPFIRGSSEAEQIAVFEACQSQYGDSCHREDFAREGPTKEIGLNSFFIDETEVSVGQYRACVAEGTCSAVDWAQCLPGDESPQSYERDGLPQVCVTWAQARDYCLWTGARLPSEAEWEKAALGQLGSRYPWGEQWNPSKANALGGIDGHATLASTRAFNPDSYGLYNMSGNAKEWVADWFDANYYAQAPDTNPRGPQSSPDGARVVRGGAFTSRSDALRARARSWQTPTRGSRDVGFRCATLFPLKEKQ